MFGYLILLIACVVVCQVMDYRLEGKIIAKKLVPSIIIALFSVFILLVAITYGGVMFLNLSPEVSILEYITAICVDVLVPFCFLFAATLVITKLYQKGEKPFIWVFIGIAACLAIAIPLESIDIYYTKKEIDSLLYSSFFDVFAQRNWPKFTYIIYTLTLIPSVLLIFSTFITRQRKLSLIENASNTGEY